MLVLHLFILQALGVSGKLSLLFVMQGRGIENQRKIPDANFIRKVRNFPYKVGNCFLEAGEFWFFGVDVILVHDDFQGDLENVLGLLFFSDTRVHF